MAIIGTITCDRDKALAFRLDSHHLARRLPPGSLLKAAGACGIQNTPPGSAALALHARVEGLKPEDIDWALAEDKTLLQVMSLRGAPLVFPISDAAIYTTGLLPEDEASLRFFIPGAGDGLDRVGMSAIELVRLTSEALSAIMDAREMTKDELGIEIAARISGGLNPERRKIWQSPSWLAGQYLGESLVRFALYVVSLQGLFCYAPRQENKARFVRTDRWFSSPLSSTGTEKARADLTRRYLHCYGPSTPGHFAEWAGIAPAQADHAWSLIKDELSDVDYDGKKTWLLSSDVPRIQSPDAATGVRFLPPHEPLLQMRDRTTLIPDKSLHRKLWRAVGNPGIVLVDGKPAAAWRSQKKGRVMNVTVETFADISQKKRPEIEAEAVTLAPYRGCSSVKIQYETI